MGKGAVASTASLVIVWLLVIILAFLEGQGWLDYLSALSCFVQATLVLEARGGEWYEVYFTSPPYLATNKTTSAG